MIFILIMTIRTIVAIIKIILLMIRRVKKKGPLRGLRFDAAIMMAMMKMTMRMMCAIAVRVTGHQICKCMRRNGDTKTLIISGRRIPRNDCSLIQTTK